MGLLKDSLKVVNEIVTLGGAGRLEEAKSLYQETYDIYVVLYKEAERCKTAIEEQVNAIGVAIAKAKPFLEKAERLIEQGVLGKNKLNFSHGTQALQKVDRFNSGFHSAINVGAGSIAGGTLAIGSWALVTTLGSASTGAAISGLSGVAAYNATMAWFGGGALAAGGAGMAGGAAVLGGLFAVPLVYIAAKRSRKRAKELEDANAELQVATVKIRDQIAEFHAALKAVMEKQRETSALCETFISDAKRHLNEISPHGIFSKSMRSLRTLIGRARFTREQAEALERLTQSVTIFLAGVGIRSEEPTSGS